VYGANVAVVEPHGLDAIDERERHGTPRDLFGLWFGANSETANFAVGIIAVSLYGTSLAGALTGLAFGSLLGYVAISFVSLAGPRFGLPQMVISRRAFGRDGNVLPAIFAFLAGVGWFSIDCIFGAQALGALLHVGYPVALTITLAGSIVIAVYGYNAIHAFERFAAVAMLLGFATIAVVVFARAHLDAPFDPHAPFAAGGEIGGIVFSAALAFAYSIGWTPCASDYARYLPATSSPRAIGLWAFGGGFLASLSLEMLGAAAATSVRGAGIASATPAETVGLLAGTNGAIAAIGLLTVLVGTMNGNVMNLYSGALSALVAYDSRRRLPFALATGAIVAVLAAVFLILAGANDPTARYSGATIVLVALCAGALTFAAVRWTLVRWQAALAVGLVGGALAVVGADPDATAHVYGNFLGLLSTWAAPWAAIMIATHNATGLRFGRAALTAWIVGIAAGVPFWQQSWFTGPIASAHPQLGDLSYFVSFAVAYAIYAGAAAIAARSRK
jgi:NCS1 family nucleobase:cation symporter-1